ncbi:MAG: IS200/IS605 family transposase [Candidatus Hydrogenedentes bacterium]|nr:IS200/IS605 family transposase [Candidatus Hydrogenedentota bacterium]
MATYTQLLYHIVFSTKHRQRTLDAPGRPELFRYVWGILKNKECHLYRINGIEDHIHILTHVHPTIAVARLVKDIKVATNAWNKEQRVFPAFESWQDGYGAFTHSLAEKDRLIEYVKNQEEHHRTETFEDELRRLVEAAGLKFDPKFLD